MTEAKYSEGAGALGVDDQAGALYAIELDGVKLRYKAISDDFESKLVYAWGGTGEAWKGTKGEAEAKIMGFGQMTRGAVAVKLNP
jgi:hypothetical protein